MSCAPLAALAGISPEFTELAPAPDGEQQVKEKETVAGRQGQAVLIPGRAGMVRGLENRAYLLEEPSGDNSTWWRCKVGLGYTTGIKSCY